MLRTRTINNNNNPEFDETFNMLVDDTDSQVGGGCWGVCGGGGSLYVCKCVSGMCHMMCVVNSCGTVVAVETFNLLLDDTNTQVGVSGAGVGGRYAGA